MIKYHIGCGKRDFGSDWIHVDGGDFPHVTSKYIFLKGEKEGIADQIYAAHLIEYFDRERVVELLNSWYRVLKHGGVLCVAVPDFSAIAKLYNDREYEIEQFLGLLYGQMDMSGEKIYHKTCYDYRSLNRLLAKTGFTKIEKVDSIIPYGFNDHSEARLPHRDSSGLRMSLNIKATK